VSRSGALDKLRSLKQARPQAADLASADGAVRHRPLLPDTPLPELIEPVEAATDLARWAASGKQLVGELLGEHRALLFRGFSVPSVAAFEGFAAGLSRSLLDYTERSTPRSEVEGKVYTSTEYPPHLPIPMHNELSYSHAWPSRIFFFCARPASEGGATPIADGRAVYRAVPEAVRRRFAEHGVLYVRNYGDELGLPWSEVFQTTDRAEVEVYCRRSGIELEWKDGDRLTTRAVRPAVLDHPDTGEPVWFNQAHLHHASALDDEQRRALLEVVSEDELPFNTFYGDGSALDDEALAAVRAAYAASSVSFPWQQGDVLMLDNEMVAHGRHPYRGERRIVVAMG